MARDRLEIRVSEDLGEELEELARRKDKSLSWVCRELMESGLNENPGRLRSQLGSSLARTQELLLRAEDGEILDDVEELVQELDDLERDLEENPDGEEEPDEDEEPEPE